MKLALGGYDPLTRLAARYGSDKGITIYPFHGYTTFYDRVFGELRERELKILEIGLRRADQRTGAIMFPSLNMWLEYFPKAQLCGMDIADFTAARIPRTVICCGDQGKTEDLLRIAAIFSGFDIIIDDGSHASWHQQLTLRTLFPRLEKGGLYIIEDLHYQPPGIEALYPGTRKTRDILEDGDALAALISGVDEATIFRSPIENDNPMDTGETAIIRKSR